MRQGTDLGPLYEPNPSLFRLMNDSIQTSIRIGLFSSWELSAYCHIFESVLVSFPLSSCRDLDNFDPARLCDDPYPVGNRPRGQDDLDSVAYHRRELRTDPIWVARRNGRYILLDGAHRIVAAYLEKRKSLPAYCLDYTRWGSNPRSSA